jgi:hypothetical protein
MSTYNEERLAALLGMLPPPPTGWVEAAQELPLVRAQLNDIISRADADRGFRKELATDLEATLEREGYEPDVVLHRFLRRRLQDPP